MIQSNHDTDLYTRFKLHVEENKFFNNTDRLFLAISGGLDSVVLAHLLKKMNCRFTLLHCNFQLRGEESERDQQFVMTLSNAMGVECKCVSFETEEYTKKWKKGVQETARKLRYDWFDKVITEEKQEGSNAFILTAHHADDQIETIAFHFLRGTGIAGLQGMKPKDGKIIRPLLLFTRKEINEYALQHNIKWVEDSSNQDSDYTRNLFRNKVFPIIEDIIPSFRQNIINNSKRFADVELLYQQRLGQIRKKLIERRDDGFAIAVNKLKNCQPLDTVIHELFAEFGFHPTQVEEIKKMLSAHTGAHIQSETFRVLKNRNWLLIDPVHNVSSGVFVIERNDSTLPLENQRMEFSFKEGQHILDNPLVACIDADSIEFPLVLRPWKKGDYFYPLGMKKKKKISRFMIDIKLSILEKERQYVLESNKKIIWLVGKRLDDRCKISASTRKTFFVKLDKSIPETP